MKSPITVKRMIILFILCLAFILIFGCTEPTEQQLKTVDITPEEYNTIKQTIQTQQQELNQTQTKVISLQETNEYQRKQLELVKEKKEELQETFNKLFTDATTCYWANDCLYYEEACINHFKDAKTGWTAKKIHIYESDKCETMIRDWDTYYEMDTSVN